MVPVPGDRRARTTDGKKGTRQWHLPKAAAASQVRLACGQLRGRIEEGYSQDLSDVSFERVSQREGRTVGTARWVKPTHNRDRLRNATLQLTGERAGHRLAPSCDAQGRHSPRCFACRCCTAFLSTMLGALLNAQLVAGLILLGIVALLPVVIRWRGQNKDS